MCVCIHSVSSQSFSAFSQVLCSNSVLDSSDYWLKNDKTLCRLGLLDDDTEGSCTTVSRTLETHSQHQ